MHVRTRVAVMLDAGFPEHGFISSAGAAGAANTPGVDDEVVVAFEHGDLRQPYLLGCLWNSKDEPPTTAR
jgi:hypothetical protein